MSMTVESAEPELTIKNTSLTAQTPNLSAEEVSMCTLRKKNSMGCFRGVRHHQRCQTTLKMVSKDTFKGILQVYYTTMTPFVV